MPSRVKKAAQSGKLGLPQLSQQMLKELIPGPVTKEQFTDIFENFNRKIDFMKIDIEGNEIDVLPSITDENLKSLRCLSAEFHCNNDEFEFFQQKFIERMSILGFDCFTLYHVGGILRTLTFWKK